jgi:hypothetical protein
MLARPACSSGCLTAHSPPLPTPAGDNHWGTVWRVVCYHGPLWIVVMFNIYTYVRIIKYMLEVSRLGGSGRSHEIEQVIRRCDARGLPSFKSRSQQPRPLESRDKLSCPTSRIILFPRSPSKGCAVRCLTSRCAHLVGGISDRLGLYPAILIITSIWWTIFDMVQAGNPKFERSAWEAVAWRRGGAPGGLSGRHDYR